MTEEHSVTFETQFFRNASAFKNSMFPALSATTIPTTLILPLVELNPDHRTSRSKNSLGVKRSDSVSSSQTWERINRDVLLRIASKEGIEKGQQARFDSMVAPTNNHYLRDSVVLEDCVRVLKGIREVIVSAGVHLLALKFSRKKARKLQLGNLNSKDNDDRVSLYEALVVGGGDNFEQVTEYLRLATPTLGYENKHILRIQELQNLMSGIIAHTMTRVLDGKQYPSADKVVSVFE